jgi:glutamate synthase domain-containing protein 3
MKGVDIIVKGSVGHMSAFMAQAGTLMICGDAGDALGDSIYETVIYLAGKPKSLGVDCIEKKVTKNDLKKIENLIEVGNIKKLKPHNFKKFGSARKLYNFNIDNVSEY